MQKERDFLVFGILVRLEMTGDKDPNSWKKYGLLQIVASDLRNIKGVEHANPRMDFKDDVRSQCSQAAKAGPLEDVLILNFVHERAQREGDRDRLWSCIGICGSAHLQGEMRSNNANVSLLTNACYSGGWTFCPRFNISSMTASGEQKESQP